MMWSSTCTSTSFRAFCSSRVSTWSARLGSAMPEGWLCDRITEAAVYTTSQVNSQAILARIYGPPAGGTDDGTARLTLVTCTGDFVGGHYDHRVVDYGVLMS